MERKCISTMFRSSVKIPEESQAVVLTNMNILISYSKIATQFKGMWGHAFQKKTRNVSMGRGCPRYCQIRTNRALSLTKGHNSQNNRWILSVIELNLYFMITYLCMKYESNTPTYSKDIDRKPFFIRRSRAITLIIIG